MVQQAKHWAFTLNNYTSEEYERLINIDQETASYLVIGKETGEEGTPHIQGHVYFRSKISARRAKTLLGERIHIEVARNPNASIEYCKKDGDYVEMGQPPFKKGKRSDLDQVKQLLDGGASVRSIAETNFRVWLRYSDSLERYVNGISRSREAPPAVIIYWGPTGTGKTRRVYEEAPELWRYPGGSGAIWFDGYVNQDDVLFDEFDGSYFKITYLLQLLDRYPVQVPIKGGFRNWKPKRIFITSNIDPNLWYNNASDAHVRALHRRISSINHMH